MRERERERVEKFTLNIDVNQELCTHNQELAMKENLIINAKFSQKEKKEKELVITGANQLEPCLNPKKLQNFKI